MKQTGTCSFLFLKLILIPQLSSAQEEETSFVTNEPLDEIVNWSRLLPLRNFIFLCPYKFDWAGKGRCFVVAAL